MRTIVIVGASLAGLRAAEALRAQGFDGELTIVGEEPHAPYNRPPLSKGLLTGADTPASCALAEAVDTGATWMLGRRATRLDLGSRHVVLDGGQRLPFDGLVIATGSRPRAWPGGPAPAGVLTLRGLDDALALRDALQSGLRRLLVVGGGFVGSEIASSAARLGVAVTLLELAGGPLEPILGPQIGALVARAHRARGVDLRTRTTVRRFLGAGRLRGAELTDGTTIEAGLAVVALGAVPNVEWLERSGLRLDGGVVCEPTLACHGARGVVAAGDVARWPHPVFDDELIAVGHWSNAAEQGRAAARTLLQPQAAEPFAELPAFWSEIHGDRIRSAGLPALADEAYVLEGSLEDHRLIAGYGRRGTLVGAVSIGMHRRLRTYAQLIAERESVGTAMQIAAAVGA